MPSSVFTDAYKIFIAILVEARDRADLTQEQLGKRLGKPQSFVSKYESSERRIDVVEFCAIADALGVAPESLLGQFREETRLKT